MEYGTKGNGEHDGKSIEHAIAELSDQIRFEEFKQRQRNQRERRLSLKKPGSSLKSTPKHGGYNRTHRYGSRTRKRHRMA
jgi:hypothetical protein